MSDRSVPWATAVARYARERDVSTSEAEAALRVMVAEGRPAGTRGDGLAQVRYRSRAQGGIDATFTLDGGEIVGVLLRTKYAPQPAGRRASHALTLRLVPELVERLDTYQAEHGLSRTDAIIRLLTRGLNEGEPLELAVERVVDELAERGREDLAAAVAIATDPTPADERARQGRAIRRWWRRRKS